MSHKDGRQRWSRTGEYLATEEPRLFLSILEYAESLVKESIRSKQVAEGTIVPRPALPSKKSAE